MDTERNATFEGIDSEKLSQLNEKTVRDLIKVRDDLSPVLCMVDVIQASADSADLIDKNSVGRVASMVYMELDKIMRQIDESIESAREGRKYSERENFTD